MIQCAQPPDYYLANALTSTSGDCNDNDAALNPTQFGIKMWITTDIRMEQALLSAPNRLIIM